MRVIIAGCRTVTDYSAVSGAVAASGFTVTEVVSGAARGVDLLGERWGQEHGVLVQRFLSDWEHDGETAWVVNNQRMAEYADALVAVWDGQSPGTGRHGAADAGRRQAGLRSQTRPARRPTLSTRARLFLPFGVRGAAPLWRGLFIQSGAAPRTPKKGQPTVAACLVVPGS